MGVTDVMMRVSILAYATILALCTAAAHALPRPETEGDIIPCQWTNSTAPFYIVVSNADASDVKIRTCPKKYLDGCTGDMSQPNHYHDCAADVKGMSTGTAILVNAGVGYVVVFYKTTGKFYSVFPLEKGGLAWPGKIEVPAQ